MQVLYQVKNAEFNVSLLYYHLMYHFSKRYRENVMISDMFIEDVGTHQDWRLKKPTLWLNTSGTDVSWEGIKGHKVMDISQA